MNNRVNKICERLQQSIKNPVSELIYISNYTFVIAVVLSAQSTDKQVNKVTSKLFDRYKTIDDILALGVDGLQRKINSIGLFRNKAKNIIALSEKLKKDFDSKVPNTREELESLPGVGRKSANVILNTLFDKDTIAVDTHVLRLCNRLGISDSKNPKDVENDLEKQIPKQYRKNISNLLVLHGRYVCKARNPKCNICVISDCCFCCW